ncbi:MAG: TetR/AcrR family transcriptional regulator [bacterium]|nr:TetR/AcrR family transcriptional regulator [bacterium]
MNREEKNALSRQRILEAALEEFSQKGYEAASLSNVCAEKGISKGIIYHHFKDKDALYLLCVEDCFDRVCAYLREAAGKLSGTEEEKLAAYFDARLRFFALQPVYLGIFAEAAFNPPPALAEEIARRRQGFDRLNAAVLSKVLASAPLRKGLNAAAVVEDFRMYMDYFNLRFRSAFRRGCGTDEILTAHENKCRRQLDILLHGVLEDGNEEAT